MLSFSYLFCVALMSLVGAFYAQISPGLAMPLADGPMFCKELMSAGSEDDAMIGAMGIYVLPLVLRLFRIRRRVALFEVILLLSCTAIVSMALWLASLDCAAIFYTAFLLPDPALAAALLCLPAAVVLIFMMRLRD